MKMREAFDMTCFLWVAQSRDMIALQHHTTSTRTSLSGVDLKHGPFAAVSFRGEIGKNEMCFRILALEMAMPDESEMTLPGGEASDGEKTRVAVMMGNIMAPSAILPLCFFTCDLRGRLRAVYDCAITTFKCLHSLVLICQQ